MPHRVDEYSATVKVIYEYPIVERSCKSNSQLADAKGADPRHYCQLLLPAVLGCKLLNTKYHYPPFGSSHTDWLRPRAYCPLPAVHSPAAHRTSSEAASCYCPPLRPCIRLAQTLLQAITYSIHCKKRHQWRK